MEHGIAARKYFYPLTSSFNCYGGLLPPDETPIAKQISERVLCLPLFADLTFQEIDKVCSVLERHI